MTYTELSLPRNSIPLKLASQYNGRIFLDIPETLIPPVHWTVLRTEEKIKRSFHETIRVLVVHGKTEIDIFWSPNLDEGQGFDRYRDDSIFTYWFGPPDSFGWLISEQRLNLMDEELEEFYFEIPLRVAITTDPHIQDLAIQKVSDLERLACATDPWRGWTMLHGYLFAWAPIH